MRLLSQEDILRVADAVGIDAFMDQVIDRLEEAFASYDPAKISIPLRKGFAYTHPQPGLLEWMPLLHNGVQALVKVVGYHPRNPSHHDLPTILSTFNLYDATTGNLEAILDGGFLTAIRTGAASAVATRLLASPESSAVGLIGCGAQAVTQLHAVSRVRDIRSVRYFDIDAATMADFADRVPFLAGQCELIPSDRDTVVETSDILCVATSVDIGGGPVFEGLPGQPHVHVNAVGSDFPGKTELPPAFLQASYVSPDCREQALVEGECQRLAASSVGAELWQVAREGGAPADLVSAATVFDSTGWALEDYVVTQVTLEAAVSLGIGTELPLSAGVGDPKSPYRYFTKQAEQARSRLPAAADQPQVDQYVRGV